MPPTITEPPGEARQLRETTVHGGVLRACVTLQLVGHTLLVSQHWGTGDTAAYLCHFAGWVVLFWAAGRIEA